MPSYEKFEKLCKLNNVTPYKVSVDNPQISTATLSSWKNGKYSPKTDKLVVLAKYFNVSVEYFLEE